MQSPCHINRPPKTGRRIFVDPRRTFCASPGLFTPKISGRTGRMPFFGTDLPRSCRATDIIPRIFAIFYCQIAIAARYFSPSMSVRAMGSRHTGAHKKAAETGAPSPPLPPLLSGAPPQPGQKPSPMKITKTPFDANLRSGNGKKNIKRRSSKKRMTTLV